MNYVDSYLKDINQISSFKHIKDLVANIILLNTGNVVLEVRDRWKHGQSVNGGIIGTYSWPDYKMFKQAMNPMAGGTVDLFLTGALAEGLTIRKQGDLFQVYSTDSKYDKIGKKYGYEEYGLTDEQKYELYGQIYYFALETLLSELWN